MTQDPRFPSDEALLKRAVIACGRPSPRARNPRWVAVMKTFGLGDTLAFLPWNDK
jgi:hypothetical protein